MTIDDIWEALLASDNMQIILRVEDEEQVELIKRTLSSYKYKLYQADPELTDLIGNFKLSYEARQLADGWKLKISGTKPERVSYGVELIEGEETNE